LIYAMLPPLLYARSSAGDAALPVLKAIGELWGVGIECELAYDIGTLSFTISS